jgi:phosphoglycerol transferase MdoB-like AlkP superfamily enzyme
MNKLLQSKLIRWMLINGLFFIILLSALRLIFHLVFSPTGEEGIFNTMWMGLRYDARVVCIFLLIVLLLGLFSFFRPFASLTSKRILLGFTRLFCILVILVYTFDFAHFAYLHQRLNASVLSYAEDANISMGMMWQSYPVLKIIVGWIVVFLLLFYVTRYLYNLANREPSIALKANRVFTYLICFFVFAIAVFGRIGQFPLRWSDAYRLNSDYKASLALNPFQSFVSSMKFRGAGFDIARTKQYYPFITPQLAIERPDSALLNYTRNITINDSAVTTKPNVVLVICESFSAYKSSMWGNPLNTTPYFNELCNKGIFFKNCFSPAYGTARGVWAIITGIPDVTELKTASRNPSLVDQHTVFNDIKGYEKFYFLGGSASWANIRGVLTGNIKDLKMYEQEDYSSPKVDVWGISDKNLFLEANKVLKQQDKPFFAIIQTADNHRPYTIPAEDKALLQLKKYSQDSLDKYGFFSNDELNAYTYMDYTFKTFFEAAAKEKYFNNTIFVFVGDHGIRGNAGTMMPKVWTEHGLTTQHIPLLFYAPSILKPLVLQKNVSQLDVMPTIASIAGMPATNTTLGKNILADTAAATAGSFIIDPDNRTIGLVTQRYFYEYNLINKKEGFYSTVHNNPLPLGEPAVEEKQRMRDITLGYYETARYMLFNNKKKK